MTWRNGFQKKLMRSQLQKLLEEKHLRDAKALLGPIQAADIADVIEELPEAIQVIAFRLLTKDEAIARQRVVWLFILLIINTTTSTVIQNQEDLLERVVVLAAFIPLLIDSGGNIGAQSSTVVIRGLHTGEISKVKTLPVVGRETVTGLLLGLMLGVAVIVWAYFLQGNLAVAIAVGISLFAISVLASIAGASLPFLFNFLNLDPALMSAPFITTAVDVLGVFIYFYVARLILQM